MVFRELLEFRALFLCSPLTSHPHWLHSNSWSHLVLALLPCLNNNEEMQRHVGIKYSSKLNTNVDFKMALLSKRVERVDH